MSEKIYAFLLRLFPARFRQEYESESLQLFRDRSRDEHGFFAQVRLWFDLLADLAVSLPREYRVQPVFFAASVEQPSHDVPAFRFLETETLRTGPLLMGALLSVAAFGGCVLLINVAGEYRPAQIPISFNDRPSLRDYFTTKNPQQLSTIPAPPVVSWDPNTAAMRPQLAAGGPANPQVPPTLIPGSAAPLVTPHSGTLTVVATRPFDGTEKERLVTTAATDLKRYYAYPDIGEKTAAVLLAHQKKGDYNAIADPREFATVLTKQIGDVSHDSNLEVVFNDMPPQLQQHALPPPGGLAVEPKQPRTSDCMFDKVEVLPHNIGYIKLNRFPQVANCEATLKKSMARVNRTRAIIFDLRDNRGGYQDMVALVASYLFDHPVHLNDFYDRVDNSTRESWTKSPIRGNRLANKPVFVLTSRTTFSGAEEFSYDLKMLKRATIVGEPTSGQGHAGTPYALDDHFHIRIPDKKAVNPISHTNWDGTGVIPDVPVDATDALDVAIDLATRGMKGSESARVATR